MIRTHSLIQKSNSNQAITNLLNSLRGFFSLLLVVFFISQSVSSVQAQCTGDITLTTQAQIDAFPTVYPSCTVIVGNVLIDDILTGDITNLDSLAQIVEIQGNFDISNNNNMLGTLSGLQHLTTVSGNFTIWNNDKLTGIDSLYSLTTVGGNLNIRYNDIITNFNGLRNLTTVEGGVSITNNYDLTDISELQNLETIGGDLYIMTNDVLTNISGLENVTSIGGSIKIEDNDALTNLDGLIGVLEIGNYIYIHENNVLIDLSGLVNIDTATITNLSITDNDLLSICHITMICNYLAGNGARVILGNAVGCLNENQVLLLCTNITNACPPDTTIYTSDSTCTSIASFSGANPFCNEIDSFSYTVDGAVGTGTIIIDGNQLSVTDTFDLVAGVATDYEVEYYIEDCLGKRSCTHTVTVQDSFPPEIITCLDTAYVQCDPIEAIKGVPIFRFDSLGGEVFENCTLNTDIATFDEFISEENCIKTYHRQYYFYDLSGNYDSCIQVIIVKDTIAPSFDVPADITIGCEDDYTDLAFTGNVTNVNDNCGIQDTSYIDERITSIDCPFHTVITRKWVVRDSCDNGDTLIQVITINDVIAPTVMVHDTIVYLDADGVAGIIPEFIDNGSFDNCSQDDVILSVDIDSFNCDNVSFVNVYLIVEDQCGNKDSLQARVNVLDTIPPVTSSPDITNTSCSMDDVPVFTTIEAFRDSLGTAEDNCGVAGIIYLPELLERDGNHCPELITRYYVVFDYSGNKDTVSHQIIINDEENPTIECPATLTYNSDQGECGATLTLEQPTTSDNCGILSLEDDQTEYYFEVGEHDIVWTVTDLCGNEASCTQTIVVEDNEDPVVEIKNNLVVPLSNTGNVVLGINQFVESSSDNCLVDSIRIRRMNDNCDNPDNLVDGLTVEFCCADVSDEWHMVSITAWDNHGNSRQYMSRVRIQNKTRVSITNCLSDVTVSCEYPIDLDDLSEFGTMVLDPALVQSREINGQTVTDGLAFENCPGQATINVEVEENIECGQGEIRRIFHVTDDLGTDVACTQTITIHDENPFNGDEEIVWPSDTVLITSAGFCNPSDFPTSTFGSPQYTADNCSMILQSYEDVESAYPETGCKQIIRTWKVMDWCQYNTNTTIPEGIWEYEQTIIIANEVAPEITSDCSDRILCLDDTNCKNSTFSFTVDATDDCTASDKLVYSYQVDRHNNGSINEHGNSKNFDVLLYTGVHRIIWTVNDRCGNFTTCEYLVTVQDCKAPSPVCLHGLAANLVNGGSVVLWASDFNKLSTDNCTAIEDLKLSFSSDITDTGKTFTCDDIGEQPIELWVTDETGNQAYCSTYVIIQDNLDICPENTNVFVGFEGRVMTDEQVSLENFDITITGPEISVTSTTDEIGHFSFEDLPANRDYHIEGKKDGDDMLGVSTLDIILIQRHILRLKKFDNPYSILAADVNNTGNVTGADIIELRKLILGKINGFQYIDSWRFVNAKYEFEDSQDPWDCQETIDYVNVSTDMKASNFIAVKLGDVNGTISDNLLNNTSDTRNSYSLRIEEALLMANNTIELPVYGSNMDIAGMQMALNYDQSAVDVLGVKSGLIDIDEGNININDKNIRLSWSGSEVVSIDNEVLFYIVLSTKEDIQAVDIFDIAARGVSAEVYDSNFNTYKINIDKVSQQIGEYKLYDAVPNPFTGFTSLKIDLPVSTIVNLEVKDVQGRLLYTEVMNGSIGENIFEITNEKLSGTTGILYYTISTKDFVMTKKMIKID